MHFCLQNIIMENLFVSNNINVVRTTGDVNFNKVDAASLDIETDTGDVEIKLAGSKLDYTITVDVDTGDTNVHNQLGGERKLRISVDTGDIYVAFEQ